MQKATISSVIICTTAFGLLFYGITVLISLLCPDSPFKSPGSHLVEAICNKILGDRPTSTDDMFGRSSAIRWILETSTNPEVVAAAAAMVPLVQWSPKVDISAAYARLFDTFTTCRYKSESYIKAMAHLWTQPVKINPLLIERPISSDDRDRLIRNAFTSGRDAWGQFTVAEEEGARQKHKADVRTALRTMVVYGRSHRLSFPDDESLIWHGDLQWRHCNGVSPSCAEFDWLVDYLADKVGATDDATEGDALLALSAMPTLGSPVKRGSYIKVLIRCLSPTRPSRVRYAALRAIVDARAELASITSDSMPQGVDAGLLDELSHALLAAILSNHIQSIPSGHVLVYGNKYSDSYYFRLLFALATNDEWRQRLVCHGHVEWCTSLVDLTIRLQVSDRNFYLAGIFSRIYPSSRDLSISPRQERWRTLMSTAWIALDGMERQDIYGCIDALPALVEATTQSFQYWDNGLPCWELCDWQLVAESVQRILVRLQALVGQADEGLVNAALPAVQGLHDDIIGHLKEMQE
ncbi:hypothetical protein AZE42_03846 [Rhizopogon vesiculosus]|uniref:Uncharacterized protein n=1 Tax=Rhizopogon vesiculosus TaxID=180088 RepID=A0A1J8QY45_9AGAM|nr:hypothetical protein AZE42_03846 [Rhizopogon vesiculosus]